MSLAERRWLRLFTLTLLFFAQGIPWGFMAIGLPAYLAERKLSGSAIGSLIAMSYWPYAFKFLAGPLIDAFTIRRFGRRRPWILFAQTMMAVTLAGLLLVDDPQKDFDLLLVLVFIHTAFNAIQNVAVDALAIDLLPEKERGSASGLMYGAKYGGGIIGAAGMANVIDAWGFHVAVECQVAILLAIATVPFLVRERAEPEPAVPGARVVGRSFWERLAWLKLAMFWRARRPEDAALEVPELVRTLGRVFSLRSPVLCAVLMLVANLAGGVLNVVSPVLFMQHLSWNQSEYSDLAGGPGLVIGLLGSFAAGFLADKLGHRRLLAIALVAMGLEWLVFAFGQAWWNDRTFVYALFFIEPLTQSIMVVSLWTLCMDNSVPRTAATQFAAYTSLLSISTILGSRYLSTALGALDFQAIYLVVGAFQIALVAFLPFIDPNQARRQVA